ncbi:hypothetical protein AKJ16_DCAP16602, partial [Drosera capensis]
MRCSDGLPVSFSNYTHHILLTELYKWPIVAVSQGEQGRVCTTRDALGVGAKQGSDEGSH